MNLKTMLVGAAMSIILAAPTGATVYTVSAFANSARGGTNAAGIAGVGVATLTVNSGQTFNVSAALTDLWSAGALPRWSNADGLVGNLYATGSDDSGQSVGTLIGQSYPSLTQFDFTAPNGALVGRINGQYQLLGTRFNGPAWNTGVLELFFWDQNQSGNNGINPNTGSIDVNVAVPEPATWTMLITGFALTGAALRRRRQPLVIRSI